MIDDDLCAKFDAHGWLVLRNVVTSERLRELNQVFDQLMQALVPKVPNEKNFWQFAGVCRSNPVLLQHLHDGLASLAARLLRAPGVGLLQDSLLYKLSGTEGSVATHQDYTYMGYLDSPSIVSIGLALTDAEVANGCLYVVDGSHRNGLEGDFHIYANRLQRTASDDRPNTPLEVRAGDVTIHHCLTSHGSYPNVTAHPRKTIVTHLFSSDCKLVRDRLPPEAQSHFRTDDQDHLMGVLLG